MRMLADTFGWELHGEPVPFDGITTDSRALCAGQLFVALRGPRFDAHRFVPQVLAAGAAGAVVSEVVAGAAPLLLVEDTQLALGQLAALHRKSFAGDVFAITGSAGKTTTREMLLAILRQTGPVLATRGNRNNEIGVPLTLLQLTPEHRYAVIEMGAARPGDIRYLAAIARPDIAIVTNAMPAHLEGFGDVDQVARTKGEIYALRPGGSAIINLDDAYSELWRRLAGAAKIFTYSASGAAAADIRALQIETAAASSHFELQTAGGNRYIELQVPGRHNIANALAAAAAALARGIGLDAVAQGLRGFGGVPGRMQMRDNAAGQLIIDDSYNANPEAMRAAVEVLARQSGKKVLVLGDMAELGAASAELHRQVGRHARQCGIDLLLAVGAQAAEAATAFGPQARVFSSNARLADWLRQQAGLSDYHAFLVKGSRSARMEQVVGMLVDEGEQ